MTKKGPGCELAVRVTPRSGKNAVEALPDGSIRMWLTAAPTEGQANEAGCKLLAECLGVAKSAVELTSGAKSRNKRFYVAGIDLIDVSAKLARR